MNIAAAGQRNAVQSGKGKLSDKEAAGSLCRGRWEAVVGMEYNAAERIRKGNFTAGSRHEESPAVVVLYRPLINDF